MKGIWPDSRDLLKAKCVRDDSHIFITANTFSRGNWASTIGSSESENDWHSGSSPELCRLSLPACQHALRLLKPQRNPSTSLGTLDLGLRREGTVNAILRKCHHRASMELNAKWIWIYRMNHVMSNAFCPCETCVSLCPPEFPRGLMSLSAVESRFSPPDVVIRGAVKVLSVPPRLEMISAPSAFLRLR